MTNEESKNTRPCFCLGFLFSRGVKYVALIHKKRPSWQAGKMNGIGGKIEKGETANVLSSINSPESIFLDGVPSLVDICLNTRDMKLH